MSDELGLTQYLTVRDAAANAAMQALLPFTMMSKMQAKMQVTDVGENVIPSTMTMTATGEVDYEALAHESYLIADAMMRARSTSVKDQMNQLLSEAKR